MRPAHGVELRADAPRRVPVVVVPMSDPGAASLLAGEVALGSGVEFALEPEVADARVGRQKIGNRVGAIVDDDQLEVGVILRGKAGERRGKEGAGAGSRSPA